MGTSYTLEEAFLIVADALKWRSELIGLTWEAHPEGTPGRPEALRDAAEMTRLSEATTEILEEARKWVPYYLAATQRHFESEVG